MYLLSVVELNVIDRVHSNKLVLSDNITVLHWVADPAALKSIIIILLVLRRIVEKGWSQPISRSKLRHILFSICMSSSWVAFSERVKKHNDMLVILLNLCQIKTIELAANRHIMFTVWIGATKVAPLCKTEFSPRRKLKRAFSPRCISSQAKITPVQVLR